MFSASGIVAEGVQPGAADRDALRLERVTAGYGKKEILHELSLRVREGEILAVVGPNGAGKSTLLKVAGGVLVPRGGTVRLAGEDVTGLPAYRRVRRGLAYLLQGGQVFPSMTVRENLEMGDWLIPAAERQEAIGRVLALFPALRQEWDRRAGLLSGGQRQGLALAMILVRRPRVLLLDEPSAGLSPRLAVEMLEKIQEFNSLGNVSVVLVEHRIREVLPFVHRAVALLAGQTILETEDPRSWVDGTLLEDLFFGKRRT